MSGFRQIVLAGAIMAAGVVGVRAQAVLVDPKDSPKIFASTCSACHKSPQGLAKSGQVAGFLRQHYTTGPEMSAAMAAYLVSAGSAPASKKGATAENAAAKGKSRKQERQEQLSAAPSPAEHAVERQKTLRGKQREAKSQTEEPAARPSPAEPAVTRPTANDPIRQAAAPAETGTAAAEAAPPVAPQPQAGLTLDLPLPPMPDAPPPELTQSAFSSSPLP